MSYEPTQWKTGDTVTSAKLNKLEQGVANSNIQSNVILIINTTFENNIIILDKTWQEIYDSEAIIKVIKMFFPDNTKAYAYIIYIHNDNDKYYITDQDGIEFIASAPDEYPQYTYSN